MRGNVDRFKPGLIEWTVFIRIVNAVLILMGFTANVFASEIYTVIDKDCKVKRGLIVDVREQLLRLLDEDGTLSTFNSNNIQFVVIHNTIENTIARLDTQTLRSTLKVVYIESKSTPDFIGIPIKFLDNLVFFFDIKGQLQVFESEQIKIIRPYSIADRVIQVPHKPMSFSYRDISSPCLTAEQKGQNKGVIPSRVLGDQVQIAELLSNFEKGFEEMESYEERTYLYAKPYLFENENRLGGIFYSEFTGAPKSSLIPIYFQWSSGRPYRFQSQTIIGGHDSSLAPTIEPFSLIESEVKSHFFHASFVGNLNGLAAGSKIFSSEKFYTNGDDFYNQSAPRSGSGLNYAALIGVDYLQWSLSFGTYYPVSYFGYQKFTREALASSAAPIVRVRFTDERFSAYLWISRRNHSSSTPGDDDIATIESLGPKLSLNTLSEKATYIRGGGEYLVQPRIGVGAHLLYTELVYSEVDKATLGLHSAETKRWSAQAFVYQKFGDYVKIRLFVNQIRNNFNFNFPNAAVNETQQKTLFGGNLEILF